MIALTLTYSPSPFLTLTLYHLHFHSLSIELSFSHSYSLPIALTLSFVLYPPVSLSLLNFETSLLESFTPSRDLGRTSLQTVGRQRPG